MIKLIFSEFSSMKITLILLCSWSSRVPPPILREVVTFKHASEVFTLDILYLQLVPKEVLEQYAKMEILMDTKVSHG